MFFEGFTLEHRQARDVTFVACSHFKNAELCLFIAFQQSYW